MGTLGHTTLHTATLGWQGRRGQAGGRQGLHVVNHFSEPMKSTQLSVSPFVLGDLWEVITGCWASVLTLIYICTEGAEWANWGLATLWNACIIK